MATNTVLNTRAVLRPIDAGSSSICEHCDEQIKFSAKVKRQQVICNVYEGERWSRVEHFHADCYATAQQPHGEAR